MAIRALLKRNTYYDSITLMSVAQVVKDLPGVEDVGAVMATELNRELLHNSDLLPVAFLAEQERVPGPEDLLIVVRAVDEVRAEEALAIAEERLTIRGDRGAASSSGATTLPVRSLEVALRRDETANLALISVAGEHAWLEAEQALRHGLHVFLFSDNVPIEQEQRLKALAAEKRLLLMGPDCGTAIINGVGLGFSNVVPRGSIGIVGASGTGMQQLLCLIAAAGLGVSQAIGTGGRDLSEAIGGVMMKSGLALLADDPQTEVIVLVSKPPAQRVAHDILAASQLDKPVVVVFLGTAPEQFAAVAGKVHLARTLTEGAELAVSLAGGDRSLVPGKDALLKYDLAAERTKLAPSQRYMRALYSGGTLCDEAMLLLSERVGAVASNIPLRPEWALVPGEMYRGHTALDLGSDEFTRGRPHPMIDPTLRLQYLARAAENPETAVILFDIVLGFCAQQNPTAVYAPAISRARAPATTGGRSLPVIVSLCGTEGDPQRLSMQRRALEAAGALVFESNVAAALAAASLVSDAEAGVTFRAEETDQGEGSTFMVAAWRGQAPPLLYTNGRQQSYSSGGDVLDKSALYGPRHVLFDSPLHIIHVGADLFADALAAQDVPVTRVTWQPAAGNSDAALSVLLGDSRVDQANQEAIQRLMAARPRLVDVRPAGEAIPGMHKHLLLHAGPPITWERMSGPLRGAIMGALLYEGLAADLGAAERLAASGDIDFAPCHHYHAVGPMAGVVSASMPVQVIEEPIYGNQAFSTLNEGLGKVLRYGANSPEVLAKLRWMQQVLGSALARAVRVMGGVELKSMIAQALLMGDECHNRNKAATSLFLREVAPYLVETGTSMEETASVLRFIHGNDHFFVNLSMATCKAATLAAHGIRFCSMVTTMARNGTDFGIRVSGLGDRWYVAPAQRIKGLYFSGFSEEDANPDIGDSAITETAGIGGFAMATAPAIVRFIGGTPADALQYTLEMYDITIAEESQYQLPPLSFRGSPVGIDIRQVVRQNLLPIINTGIAHRLPGIGQVGAGIVHPPMDCFVAAVHDLAASIQ